MHPTPPIMHGFLFHSWSDLGRVVVATTITFALVVAILRVVGAQAIATMSGYDMVATVTLGSIVATVAVSRDMTIADGVAALLTLIGLQEAMRWAQSRYLKAHHLVRQAPLVFVWNGELLEDRLRESRVSADEVRAAIRKAGLASVEEVRIVVLENDGDWSVIRKSDGDADGDESAFYGLPIPERPGNSRDASGHEAERAPADRLP